MIKLIQIGLASALLSVPVHAQEGDQDTDYEAEHTIAAPISENAQAVVKGLNAFSLDIYKATRISDQKHFISPASI